MNIQKRIYKFGDTKQEIQQRIARLSENSNLVGSWKDENNFILKNKSPFALFRLHGNIDEIHEKGKLKIEVTADYRYFLLFMLPVGFTLYGIWNTFTNLEKGIIYTFLGILLIIFVFAYTTSVVYNLKRSFKESFNLM